MCGTCAKENGVDKCIVRMVMFLSTSMYCRRCRMQTWDSPLWWEEWRFMWMMVVVKAGILQKSDAKECFAHPAALRSDSVTVSLWRASCCARLDFVMRKGWKDDKSQRIAVQCGTACLICFLFLNNYYIEGKRKSYIISAHFLCVHVCT